MRKAKYLSELKRYKKSSSDNGSIDVAVLQNDTSHTASTENVTSHMVPNQACTKPPQRPNVVRHAEN